MKKIMVPLDGEVLEAVELEAARRGCSPGEVLRLAYLLAVKQEADLQVFTRGQVAACSTFHCERVAESLVIAFAKSTNGRGGVHLRPRLLCRLCQAKHAYEVAGVTEALGRRGAKLLRLLGVGPLPLATPHNVRPSAA